MLPRDIDTRTVTLVDIPLVIRLIDKATVLDNQLAYTRDVSVPNGTTLSDALLAPRVHTLVTRSDKEQAIGQFRLRSSDSCAQIVYLAPRLDDNMDNTLYLHTLDAMAREAGKNAARSLVAEVDEASALFETMRNAGYAVYARQQIWRRLPGNNLGDSSPLCALEEGDITTPGVQPLLAQTIAPLLRPITAPPSNLSGWVYRQEDKTAAYIAVSEGKNGVYLIPYLHPGIISELGAIFTALVQRVQSKKRPIYICVRRHQDWMTSVLEQVDFEPGPNQAVMVKHLTAGVRQASFEMVQQPLGTDVVPVKPPSNSNVVDILD